MSDESRKAFERIYKPDITEENGERLYLHESDDLRFSSLSSGWQARQPEIDALKAEVAKLRYARAQERKSQIVEKEIAFTCEKTQKRWVFKNTLKLIEAFLEATARERDAPRFTESFAARKAEEARWKYLANKKAMGLQPYDYVDAMKEALKAAGVSFKEGDEDGNANPADCPFLREGA